MELFCARCRALVFDLLNFMKLLVHFSSLSDFFLYQLYHPALLSTLAVCCPPWACGFCPIMQISDEDVYMGADSSPWESDTVSHQVDFQSLIIVVWAWLSSQSQTQVIFHSFSLHLSSLATKKLKDHVFNVLSFGRDAINVPFCSHWGPSLFAMMFQRGGNSFAVSFSPFLKPT